MTSQWVARRKLAYGGIVVAGILIFVALPLYLYFYKSPSCFDNKKNQNEKAVDCGGVCARICLSDIKAPVVMWQRVFQVKPGYYNAVAYIQNPNVLNRVDDVGYVFRLYDKDNAMITEKSGRTFLSANQSFAVFEAGIRTGPRIPVRTSFEFTEPLTWAQNAADYKEPQVVAENVTLTDDSTLPRIDVSIHNLSFQPIKTLAVVGVIYDAEDNAIAASRTIVENLSAQSRLPVTFTWPAPFPSQAVRKEIILRIYPDGFAL